jgi:two-component system OmpR family sensor kinase
MPKRPRLAQLRTRVLVGVLSITLAVLAVFDIAAVTGMRRYLLSHTDAQLQTVLTVTRPLSSAPTSFGWVASLPAAPRARAARPRAVARPLLDALAVPTILNQYRVAFVPGHGPARVLLRGPGLQPRLPRGLPARAVVQAPLTVTSLSGNGQLRLRAVAEAGGTLIATTSLRDVSKTVGQLELIVIIGSLAAALLVALGVAWVARRGLRPIEAMAAQADRITAGDLTDRVSQQDPRTEVGRLAAALNGMLARIEASMREREASQDLTRRFFADASHELRTPLASLRANAELYQQGALPDRPQVDEAMRRISLESARMGTLVDDMLRLARLDQHPDQQYDPVDLTALIRECAQRAQLASPAWTWPTCIAPGLTTTGDTELLRRALDNLLANVVAHTPAGTTATLTAARHDSTITVDVSDDGPGVPASALSRIFDRFYRASPPASPPGSGLGLAIAAAIATAHHGTATAAASHPRGLCITLTLPAADQPA